MKPIFGALAASVMISGAALASPPVPADVNTCFGEVQTALETNTTYDAFVPTQFLDEARVYEWKAPYSDANTVPVATLVIIEGTGRDRGDHSKTKDVTIKCGMDLGVVKVIDVIDGHGVKIESPVQPERVN